MRRFLTMFTLAATLLLGFALPHAAQADTVVKNGITCKGPIGNPALNGNYPDDGSATTAGHDYWCGTAFGDTSHAYQMVQAVAGLADKNTLQTAGVTYYIFGTRAEEATFWGTGSKFFNNTNYCGFTGDQTGMLGTSTINVSIWVNCVNKWTGGTDTNVWISEVTSHESGHAFDFAIAKMNMMNPSDNPSRSAGFQALVNADLAALDASGHRPTCQLFGDGRTPSGAESNWPATHLPAVCNNNGVVNSTYASKTNLAIAKLVSPYFVSPPSGTLYQEIWAQEFVLQGGSLNSNQVVPATNGLLPNFFCSNAATRSYYLFGTPPAANTYPTGCPQIAPSQFQ